MKNAFTALPFFRALTAAAFVALTTLANAQFYVGHGTSCHVGKVTFDGIPSTFATFTDTQGITNDTLGNVYVADGSTIRQITPGGGS